MKKFVIEKLKKVIKPLVLGSAVVTASVCLSVGVSATEGTQKHATGYLGNIEEPEIIFHNDSADAETGVIVSKASGYASYYRNENLPAVRDQGSYGTCWAFATVGACEINLIQNGYADSSINLSELPLANVAYYSVTDPLGNFSGDSIRPYQTYNWMPCCTDILNYGGTYILSSAVLTDGVALLDESDYPAIGYDMALYYSYPGDLSEDYAFGTNFTDSYSLKEYHMFDATKRNAIKQAVLDYGSVATNYYYDETFDYGTNGYSYYCDDSYYSGNTNHAVLIVGWDDDYSASNFNTRPSGNGAWIVRNSWGDYSYDGGYFYLSYYDYSLDSVGFAYEMEPSDYQVDHIYQYDGAWGLWYDFASDFDACANVFQAASDETLNEVSFELNEDQCNYSIYVYTDLTSSSKPTSGTLASSVSGYADMAGSVKVTLPKALNLAKGSLFSVVVQVHNASGDTASFIFDLDQTTLLEYDMESTDSTCGLPEYFQVKCNGDGTYLLQNGKWNGCDTFWQGSARIKAYTTNGNTGEDASVTAPATVKLLSVLQSASGIRLKWNEDVLARGYIIYRSTNGGEYKKLHTIGKSGTTSYLDEDIVAGNKYSYRIKTYTKVSGKIYRSSYSNTKSATYQYPSSPVVTAKTQASSILLSWKKVTAADGYIIYRSIGTGNYKQIKKITSGNTLKYTDSSADKNGKRYRYKVIAYRKSDGTTYKSAESEIATIYFLSRPKLSALKSKTSGQLSAGWTKNSQATGYQLRYKTGSADKKATIKGKAKVTYTLTSLKKGKTYKVYVRAYKKVNGVTYYSAWSVASSVKIKK